MSKVIRLNDGVLSLLDQVRGLVDYNMNDPYASEIICGTDSALLAYVLTDYLSIKGVCVNSDEKEI